MIETMRKDREREKRGLHVSLQAARGDTEIRSYAGQIKPDRRWLNLCIPSRFMI
jgi:hypothetical protein